MPRLLWADPAVPFCIASVPAREPRLPTELWFSQGYAVGTRDAVEYLGYSGPWQAPIPDFRPMAPINFTGIFRPPATDVAANAAAAAATTTTAMAPFERVTVSVSDRSETTVRRERFFVNGSSAGSAICRSPDLLYEDVSASRPGNYQVPLPWAQTFVADTRGCFWDAGTGNRSTRRMFTVQVSNREASYQLLDYFAADQTRYELTTFQAAGTVLGGSGTGSSSSSASVLCGTTEVAAMPASCLPARRRWSGCVSPSRRAARTSATPARGSAATVRSCCCPRGCATSLRGRIRPTSRPFASSPLTAALSARRPHSGSPAPTASKATRFSAAPPPHSSPTRRCRCASGAAKRLTSSRAALDVAVSHTSLWMRCSPCISLIGSAAFPLPFALIAWSVVKNLVVGVFVMFVVQPRVQPKLARIKLAVVAIVGLAAAAAPREVSQREFDDAHELLRGGTCGAGASEHPKDVNDKSDSGDGWTPARQRGGCCTSGVDRLASEAVYASLCDSWSLAFVAPDDEKAQSLFRQLVQMHARRARAEPSGCFKRLLLRVRGPTAVDEDKTKRCAASADTSLEAELLDLHDEADDPVIGGSGGDDDNDGRRDVAAAATWNATDEAHMREVRQTLEMDGFMEPVMHKAFALDAKFLSPPPIMLAAELCTNVLNIAVAAFAAAADPAIMDDGCAVYQAAFFSGINSCAMTNLMLNATLADLYHRRFGKLPRSPFLVAAALLYLPVLVTHVVPGIAIFAVVTVPCIAVAVAWAKMLARVEQCLAAAAGSGRVGHVLLRVAFRFGTSMAVHVCVQLAYNCTLLWYPDRGLASGTSDAASHVGYVDAIRIDYRARSIPCQVEGLTNTVNALQTLTALVLPSSRRREKTPPRALRRETKEPQTLERWMAFVP